MDFRVNEVGALIFKPTEKEKPTVDSLNKEIIDLRTRVEILENKIMKSERIADDKLSSFK